MAFLKELFDDVLGLDPSGQGLHELTRDIQDVAEPWIKWSGAQDDFLGLDETGGGGISTYNQLLPVVASYFLGGALGDGGSSAAAGGVDYGLTAGGTSGGATSAGMGSMGAVDYSLAGAYGSGAGAAGGAGAGASSLGSLGAVDYSLANAYAGSQAAGLGSSFGSGVGSSLGAYDALSTSYGTTPPVGSTGVIDYGLTSGTTPTSNYGFNPNAAGEGFQYTPGKTGLGPMGESSMTSMMPEWQQYAESPFGRMVRNQAGNYSNTADLVNAGYEIYKGNVAQGMGQAAANLTNNAVLGEAVSLGTDYAQGNQVSGADVGSVAGRATNHPLGNVVGTATGAALGGENMWDKINLGQVASGLGGLYALNRAKHDAQAAMGGVDLQGLYGPNSAYAQQLRQELNRRDAAAGRRSQYGPREVELQAKLAEQMGRVAPGIQQQNMALAQQQAQLRNAKIQTALQLGKMSGLGNASLSSLFDSNPRPGGPGYNTTYANPLDVGPVQQGYSSPYSSGLNLNYNNGEWSW